jgi:hypothetical protein
VEGGYLLVKNKVFVRYKIYLGNEQKGTAISLEPMKGLTEDLLVERITESIEIEINGIIQSCKFLNR